jgi:hypothetical protein
MANHPFRHRAIAHLRDRLDIQTTHLPESRIEDEHGNAGFDASLVRTRTARAISLGSLYALTTAAIVALVGERPMSAAAHAAFRYAAFAIAVGAIAAFVAGVFVRRRSTTALRIQLRGDSIVEAGDIEAVRNASGDRETWIVAAHGFTDDALAAAARLRVRCFAARGDAIAECGAILQSAEKAA